MVLITILILALALLPVTERAEALALVDDIIITAVGSILFSVGIKYATDAEWRGGAQDFIAKASKTTIDNIKTTVTAIVGAASYVGYGFKMMFDAETWKIITGDIEYWYGNAYSDATSNITAGKDGTLGFTADSQFSVDCDGGTVQITLGDYSMLTLDSATPLKYIYPHLPYKNEAWINDDSQYGYGSMFSVYPFNLQYYSYIVPGNSNYKFSGTLKSDIEKSYKSFNNRVSFSFTNQRFGTGSFNFLSVSPYSYLNTSMYSVDGTLCYFTQCVDGKYRFVNADDFNPNKSNATDDTCVPLVNYNTNKTYYSFDTPCDMFYTVLDGAGLRHYTDSQKNVSDVDKYRALPVPITGTVPDVYNGAQSVGITVPDDLVKSNDMTTLNEMTQADVIEYVDTASYPDGVPKIDSSGLFDKFPFCLPVDIYNMITGFYSPAEAPRYVIPIKLFPQNDGYLIDYSLVVDFNFLDPVIPIIRYGTSFIFIVGLILITRKMIGAQ